MKKLLPLLLLPLFLLLTAGRPPRHTVFMIGDSTMADKSIADSALERGWGMMLAGFFTDDIAVSNHAVNGRSSKSFLDEGRWEPVREQLKPGDYVVIQFGHNDEKPKADRHTDPGTTFDDYLRLYCRETLERGATPILMNAIVRRHFVGDTLTDTHGAYLDSPRRVADELGVPFVDANRITHDLVQGLGDEPSKKLFMHIAPGTNRAVPKGRADDTHLNIRGGRVVAGLLVDAMADVCPEMKPSVRHYDYVVDAEGRGDFFSLQQALDAMPDTMPAVTVTLLLRAGVYDNKVMTTKEIILQTPNSVIP